MTLVGRYSKVDQALLAVSEKSLRTQMRELCGEELGYGVHRDVYVLKQDPRFVVKVERDMSTADFANVCEWRNWIDNQDWELGQRWLAPCIGITVSGQLLVQRRVRQYKSRPYPEKVPAIFTDLKCTNFGWIGKRFVCCDYSFFLMRGMYMKRAKWWSHDV